MESIGILFHNLPFSPIFIINSSSDLINFEEYIKNFLISLWIRPLFTIIPFNSRHFHQISKFGNIFDMRPCEINDLVVSSCHIALNSRSYNGSDETSEERIATVRSRSKGRNSRRFINASQTLHPDRPSRSIGHDIFKTVHGGPFHCNCRSFRSGGYAQMPYKMTCSYDL